MNTLETNKKYSNQNFEDIKHIDENGIEYWYARELQLILDYKEWRKFEGVIEKATKSCENSNINTLDHFVGAAKMVHIGSGAKRMQKDYKLTRYACEANETHYEVGAKVRKTIKELGGTMPEDFPTPEKSLKQLEKENKKSLKRK